MNPGTRVMLVETKELGTVSNDATIELPVGFVCVDLGGRGAKVVRTSDLVNLSPNTKKPSQETIIRVGNVYKAIKGFGNYYVIVDRNKYLTCSTGRVSELGRGEANLLADETIYRLEYQGKGEQLEF